MSSPHHPEGVDRPPGNRRLQIARPDPEDRNASAADRLTNAVICLLVEQAETMLADALKPADVAQRAGMSRASYYRTEGFPVNDARTGEARADVLAHALAGVLDASANDVSQVVGSISEYLAAGWISDSPREFIFDTAEQNFQAMQHHYFMMQLLAATLVPSSPTVESTLHDFYTRVTESYAKAYEQLLAFWGHRLKPPMDARKFAVLLMALAEGLMIRHLGDGDIDAKGFAELISSVASAFVVANGDVVLETTPPEHDLPGEVPPPNRTSIIATLSRMFASDRIGLPAVEELARAAGCSPHTIRSQFGGVIGVVHAAWDDWMPEFEEIAERQRLHLRQPDPLTVLRRVAVAVAVRAAEQRALSRALLMSEAGVVAAAAAARPEAISAIFGRLLTEAAERGEFRPTTLRVGGNDSAEQLALFARVLRTTLLNIVVSHPAPPGADHVDHAEVCVDYVWAMLVPARHSIE